MMNPLISNIALDEIDEVFRLYGLATEYQKQKPGVVPWPEFNHSMVEEEILSGRLFKLAVNNKIACTWAITFRDPEIWKERNEDPALYIHRIATDPEFRGMHFVKYIVTWAKQYCKDNNKSFIRMDTVGENLKLIDYYTSCGFTFLGLSKITDFSNLPAHYHDATVSFFEIKI
jgi:hypothetical protein